MALDSRASLASSQTAFVRHDSPVCSGESVIFLEGDVTILGSMASGAEMIIGGSIHVYGALRGRAIARSAGHPGARVSCRSFEAELLGIGGLFKAADEVEPALVGRPVQAWLEGEAIRMAVLN